MITSTSPQNSQMICRQAPHGGVGAAVSATTAMRRNERLPFRQRLEDRDAFGAHRQAVGRVLDVAAGDDLAALGLERGADLETGEIGDRVLTRARARPRTQLRQSRPMMPSSSAMNCPFTCCAVSITSE